MTTPLTFAICSNRPDQLRPAVERLLRLLRPEDQLIVVADLPTPGGIGHLVGSARHDPRVRVLGNGTNLGLSHSRNRAMKEAVHRHLVFLDDDITTSPATVTALRATLADGAHVAGTRITADLQGRHRPWFLAPGQLHYLGCHRPGHPASIWGGCFALDIEHARLLGVTFQEHLGRTASTLSSAEDTTLVRDLVEHGATSVTMHSVEVTHQIPAARLCLTYLLRRAYWQGRSEVRRGTALPGLRKEWRRNRTGSGTVLRLVLALLYTSAVALGAGRELVRRPAPAHHLSGEA
jgi:hypothetical protein